MFATSGLVLRGIILHRSKSQSELDLSFWQLKSEFPTAQLPYALRDFRTSDFSSKRKSDYKIWPGSTKETTITSYSPKLVFD